MNLIPAEDVFLSSGFPSYRQLCLHIRIVDRSYSRYLV